MLDRLKTSLSNLSASLFYLLFMDVAGCLLARVKEDSTACLKSKRAHCLRLEVTSLRR